MAFSLAPTVWPRSGCDRANRSRTTVAGPTAGRVRLEVALAHASPNAPMPGLLHHGVVVAPDGDLRVAAAGKLYRIGLDGIIRWCVELREGDGRLPACHSAPLALATGDTMVTLDRTLIIADANGELMRCAVARFLLSDSGMSPNLTDDGEPLATGIFGQLAVVRSGRCCLLRASGIEVPPPAIYADGSLGVCHYAEDGYVRVRTDGTVMWRSGFVEADVVPSVNQQQFAAVASRRGQVSAFYSPQGERMGSYPEPAIFAEHDGDAWAARSSTAVARLALDGRVLWKYSLPAPLESWACAHPIVDATGRVFVGSVEGVLALDPMGALALSVPLTSPPAQIAIIEPGRLAAVMPGRLVLIE